MFASDIDTYVRVSVIDEAANTQTYFDLTPGITGSAIDRPLGNIQPFAAGSDFHTYKIDLTSFVGKTVRIHFELKGRGDIPQSYLDSLAADDNDVLNMMRAQGTALLLDNLILHAGSGLAVEPSAITQSPIDANNATVTGMSVPSIVANESTRRARVYFLSLSTGDLLELDAADDGSFSQDLAVGKYLLYYSTPKTTNDNTSDRLFSPSVQLTVSGN